MTTAEQYEQFKKEAAALKAFHDQMLGEINEFGWCFAGKEEESPFVRRTYFRTIFSIIEAYVTHLKRSALLFTIGSPETFTAEEILALREQELVVSEQGVVTTKTAHIALKNNVRLAFRSYAKAMGHDCAYELDFSDEGQSFIAAIKIRNRLMHPKDASSWQISDAELETGKKAWLWFTRHLAMVSEPE